MLALIDHRAPKSIFLSLEASGICPRPLPSHPTLPKPVAAHPDMNLFFAQEHIFCTELYADLAQKELLEIERASGRKLVLIEEALESRYPCDIPLNVAQVGAHIFCHPTHTAKAILKEGYRVIRVRQGYAKCSTVPVGEHALITSDPSIASAATKAGLDVLKVSPAHVDLPGYDTGFLGGAASYSPYRQASETLFCGDLSKHPNAAEIEDFCNRRSIRTVSLTADPLTDLGTVFLI